MAALSGMVSTMRSGRASALSVTPRVGLFANLRPVKLFSAGLGVDAQREVVEGTDMLVVRELTGGFILANPRA